MMIILMVAAQVLAVGFCLFGAWRLHRRRRARALVDENWWPDFECQFRAYAARYERHADVRAHEPRDSTREPRTGHRR